MRIRRFALDSGSLVKDMNKEQREWDHHVSENVLSKRVGNKNGMPQMGRSSVGLEGEPSGTHGKYTVKVKRDRKMWKILCFLLQREDGKKRNVSDPSQ